MSRRVIIEQHGPAEVMQLVDTHLPPPPWGEVRIRHTAIGLNFIDVYHRSGLYPLPLPSGLGLEAVGIVEAVGDGVTGVSPGQRVAYASPPPGAYASARNYVAERLLHIPPNLTDEAVACGLLKGLTAWYLLHATFPVHRGHKVLIYAAAGGVGQILARWARHLGADVYGVVGSETKREIALWAGCDEVYLLDEDYVAALRARGGMDVAYDSLGAVSFERSLDCLKPRGLMVSYGNASGPVPPFAPALLADKGSLFVTRPSLMDYIHNHAELQAGWEALSDLMIQGVIRCEPAQRFALSDVAEAHRALESRQTTGASVLLP